MATDIVTGIDRPLPADCEAANRGYLFFWWSACAFLIGLVVVGFETASLMPVFLVAGYSTLFAALVKTVRVWRDVFNPLCLVLAISLIRFSVPALLQLSGVEPAEEVWLFFRLMGLSSRDWWMAHALALTGALAVIHGWYLLPGRPTGRARVDFSLPAGAHYAALAGMAVGFMALAAFIRGNASLDVIASGEFRGTTIQAGTGKLYYLAFMLIAGSTLLCNDLLLRQRKWLSFLPVVVPVLLYGVLGGRLRAITAVAAGLLLHWYRVREKGGWAQAPIKLKYFFIVPLMAAAMVWFLYLGQLYRGGLGSSAFAESLSLDDLWQYIQGSIYVDIGHLHALAGAVAIGPGVLGGKSFLGTFSWPLSEFLPIPGRSAGVFIIETLVGFLGDRRWGLHTLFIGETYLNFGLAGVAIIMVLFGVLLKALYVNFRAGNIQSSIYVLVVLHAVQFFLISIDIFWQQGLTVVIFTLAMIYLGKTVLRLR
jgi:oligosaccharide repeat unit polymerase